MVNWISEKEVVAANEELGKDLEHVEILQKRFQDFMHDVMASEDRVLEVDRMADALLEARHTGAQGTIRGCGGKVKGTLVILVGKKWFDFKTVFGGD